MMRAALSPVYEPSADFADRVVAAALIEKRGREKRTALLGVVSASFAAIAALGCLMLEVERGSERDRASRLTLVEEERATQAWVDSRAEKLDEMMRAAAAVAAPEPAEMSPQRAAKPRRASGRAAGPLSRSMKMACSCTAGDPLCSCL